MDAAEKAKTACDQCHRCKLRCTRDKPQCQRCGSIGSACTYSTGKPLGKPRGSKNREKRKDVSLDYESQSDVPRSAKRHCNGSRHPNASNRQPNYKNSKHRHLSLTEDLDPSFELIDAYSPLPRKAGNANKNAFFQNQNRDAPPESSTSTEDDLSGLANFVGHKEPELHLNLKQPNDDSSYLLQTPVSPPPPSVVASQFLGLHEIDQPSYFDLGSPSTFLDFANGMPSSTIEPNQRMSSGSGCLCNPSNLRITEEVCSYQFESLRAAAPTLSHALSTFHRAITTCENYITCEKCRNGTLNLACLLISQQVLQRFDALLSLLQQQQGSMHDGSSHGVGFEGLKIGEFEIPEQSVLLVVKAIVQAEMERGRGVMVKFKELIPFDAYGSRVSLPA